MTAPTEPESTAAPPAPPPRQRRAIGPRLRRLFHVVLGLLALLGANSAYLAGVTFLNWATGESHDSPFYLWMFLAHLVLGLVLVAPFLVFGVLHARNTWQRKNRRAVRVGWALFGTSILVLVTGLLLVRTFADLRHPTARSVVYWLHVGAPVVAGWLYWLHRLVGPRLQWRTGLAYGAATAALVVAMIAMHRVDPRTGRAGPESGAEYFEPSLARTADGKFVPPEILMRDEHCKKCHADVHARWADSVHRFSSFNNPAYLASVMETREVALKRDGDVKASRWCAGCHDPVPFLGGRFDDPEFDVIEDATATAGITCTVCHSVTHVDGSIGNANYTIEEPPPYPFEGSDNALLAWVNEQLVKAKPALHKRTFLKPLHTKAEFCGACHKVHLPFAVTHYRDFLRGQNHYDAWLLSGVSGHGARSFYYPPVAQQNCNGCHMPGRDSIDFGARPLDDSGKLKVHDHLFPGSNTGVAWLRDREEIVAAHRDFLEDSLRVDLFALRADGDTHGELTAPLRPNVPTLEPGRTYLLEAVVRTLTLGHLFTQGTADSNEVWVDVTVRSGDRVIGRSGAIDPERGNEVDPWAEFLNVFMLDRNGERIDRRNAQDIVTPLYNHQIPPGAARIVSYELALPEDLDAPVTVEVAVRYRKFDQRYMEYVADRVRRLGAPIRGTDGVNDLPIVTLASDELRFPVAGVDATVANEPRDVPEWIRWNDYGIGLLRSGIGRRRHAERAFREVERLDRWDGPMNLARLHEMEGDLTRAVAALHRAAEYEDEPGFPWWTWSWLSGLVNAQQQHYDEAAESLRRVLEHRTAELDERGFDFSRDYVVVNELGGVLFDHATVRRRQERIDEAITLEREAVEVFERTLAIDAENVAAHYNLQRLYERLGDTEAAARHRELHQRYTPDETAEGRVMGLARQRYPAANHASEEVYVHDLRRAGAPGLPVETTEVRADDGRREEGEE